MSAFLAVVIILGVIVFVLHQNRPDLLQKVVDKVLKKPQAAAPTPPPVNPPVDPVPPLKAPPKPYDPTPIDFSPLPPRLDFPPMPATPPPGGPNGQIVPPVFTPAPDPAPAPSYNAGTLPPDTSSTLYRRTPCAIPLDLKVRTQVKWVKIPEIHAGPTGAIVDGVPNPTPQGFAWMDPGPHTLVFTVPGHNMAIQIV